MDPAEHRFVEIRPMELIREGSNLVREQYWMLVFICAVGVFIGSVAPLSILMGPMMCGIYLCMFLVMRGGRASFELLFKGFEYFVESLVATLIPLGIMLVVMFGVWFVMFIMAMGFGAMSDGDSAGPGVAFILLLIVLGLVATVVLIAVNMLFMFAYLLIVDRKMQAVPALKASIAAVRSHFMGLLGLMLLNGLFSMLAALFCYLPLFLYLPVAFASITLAYRAIFPEINEEAPAIPMNDPMAF